MKILTGKRKLNIGRLAAAAAVFGVSWLVLAYFLGYYDFTFLDRRAVFGELTAPDGQSSAVSQETDAQEPDETLPTIENNQSGGDPQGTKAPEMSSVLNVFDSNSLPDAPVALPFTSDLADYTTTDAPFDASRMALARIRFDFKLPTAFSLGTWEVEKVNYVVPEEYAPYVAEYTAEVKDRPAVWLYMGMIFLDMGDSTVIATADGTPLCSFDPTVYKPANTRDSEDRPLFVKSGENGEKTYFYLSEDGKSFIKSDYNDTTDGRGLYFDYPAYFGKSDDGTIFREYNAYTGKWAYRTEYTYISYHSYNEAYDFTDGLAWVTSDQNRGGMYFINEYGWPIQQTFVTFINELDRHFIWDFALPASRGIENLGFFYFDHGLSRVRYQVIDYYNWTKGRVRVISDEDKLVSADGSFFPLPYGYTLKAYSDGMILLEKDGLYGFMDYTGGWIAQPCYASATPFMGGLAVLETADGRFGMIDTAGNIVLPFTYDHISMVSSGVIAAYREENGWSVIRVGIKNG